MAEQVCTLFFLQEQVVDSILDGDGLTADNFSTVLDILDALTMTPGVEYLGVSLQITEDLVNTLQENPLVVTDGSAKVRMTDSVKVYIQCYCTILCIPLITKIGAGAWTCHLHGSFSTASCKSTANLFLSEWQIVWQKLIAADTYTYRSISFCQTIFCSHSSKQSLILITTILQCTCS